MKKEMKKNLFMVAAVVLMALVSCNKEEINNVGEPQEPQTPEVVEPSYYVEFTADLGAEETVTPTVQQSATRTTIDVANKKTLWVDSDAISINGKKFVVKELIDGGLSARFVNEGELGTDFKAPYTAKYPYKANQTVEIPATQTAVEGGINPAYVPAVAYSDDNLLSFKHAASLLRFQVPAACKEVKLSSDDALAGTLTVTMPNTYDGTPTVSASGKEVTISGDFKTGKDYYIAVLPGKKNNFVVRIDGYLSKNAASVTVNRSTIADMKALPAPVASGWTIVGAHNSWNASTGIKLYNDISGAVAKNVTGGSEFKLVKNGSEWFSTMVPAGKKGSWCKLHMNRVNMKPASGSVDVWVNADGTACGVVDKNASMPSTYQYYVVLQHNWSWSNRKLHSWIVNPESNLMGNWPGSSPKGTFNYDNNGYSYWEIPTKANEVRIGVIFSNNGSDQTQNHYIDPLNTDKCYWLEYRSGKGNFPVEM